VLHPSLGIGKLLAIEPVAVHVVGPRPIRSDRAQALGSAQKRRGATVTGSARPPRSTLTRSCDGPRHTLPAMTRAGSQGNRSLLSAMTRTTGDKDVGAPDTAAGMSSRVIEMPGPRNSGA